MLFSLSVHLGPLSIVSSILACGPVFGVHYTPDGPLLSLPFETLQLGGQRVLAQHDLSYTQSLSMYAMVKARAEAYAQLPGRKSLLAMGAAQYRPSRSWMERGRILWMDLFAAWGVGEKGQTPAPPNTRTPLKHAELTELVLRGGDPGVAGAFKRLGRQWPNIPSALEELQSLGRLFPDAALYTEESATEAQLQALNQTQTLTQYRYLLFATHGFLHPDYPFLDAIVLGQLHNPPGTDGYVTASEWAGYQLQGRIPIFPVMLSKARDGN
jgi:CHAT domain-containing protein